MSKYHTNIGTKKPPSWRFSEINSEGYRRGVNRLAERLVNANRQAEETIAATSERMEETVDDSTDDSPGLIDLLATSEEMLSRLPETLGSMTDDINKIGEILPAVFLY